ncbi:hypothetical protein ABE10_10710 [Bacillus toyonensis]|nr:hypothetical protein [Bacillus toyonensis]
MGVIYMPEPERKPQRPIVSADTYPLGTRWRSDDSSVWEVEWDNQDKRHMWALVADRPNGSDR